MNELQETGNSFQVRLVKRNYTQEVTQEVRILMVMKGEMSRKEMQIALGLKDQEHFRSNYLLPAIKAGFIEMTIPDKPTSSKQRYRITKKGLEKIKDYYE